MRGTWRPSGPPRGLASSFVKVSREIVNGVNLTYNRTWDSHESRTVKTTEGVLLGVASRTMPSSHHVYSATRADGAQKGAIKTFAEVLDFLTR